MYHGNLKVCQLKKLLFLLLLLLELLIIAFLHQLNGAEIDFFTVFKLDMWSQDLNSGFTFKDCLFGGVKLAENPDPDKYIYTGYDIGFD